MTEALWALFAVGFVCFLLIVLRGAPFVPTRSRDVEALFELHRFKKNERLVDLGSGDGRVVIAAAERGIRATGFELNPILVAVSRLRLGRFKSSASISLADFWMTPLPTDTAVVFVFLADPFTKKLDSKLARDARRLGHDLILISYGVEVPGRTPERTKGGLLKYRYKA